MTGNDDSNADWHGQFVQFMESLLREKEVEGVLRIERLEQSGTRVTTVLEVSPDSWRRYGRSVDSQRLRSMFIPDRPSAVAEAWFQAIYPPDSWNPDHVTDGVMWHAGERPD